VTEPMYISPGDPDITAEQLEELRRSLETAERAFGRKVIVLPPARKPRKRVLLTGAGGFAGAHALEHILVNTNWDVVCVGSFRHRGKTDRITDVLAMRPEHAHRVSVIIHDLTAPFSTQTLDKIGRCDYVLAYASESHVNRSISDPVPFIMNNTGVMLNTLEYARTMRPDVFVHVSTDEVYGPVKEGAAPFKEWDAILPSNPYSASKAAQEAIGFSYWRTYDVPVMIVNSMNIIGERQDAEKFVPLVIKGCLEDREIVIHGSADQIGTRHYMHARNLADAILFLIGKGFGVRYSPLRDRLDRFNVAPDDSVDNLTLAQKIAGYMGKELKYRFEDFPDQRPGHDRHYGLDNVKLTELDWEPPIDLWSSLKKTVEWTLAHPQWLKNLGVSCLCCALSRLVNARIRSGVSSSRLIRTLIKLSCCSSRTLMMILMTGLTGRGMRR
jgi:dTDP-glucose 4,6-dehydratase